jgi:molybdopterin molybdotransferase
MISVEQAQRSVGSVASPLVAVQRPLADSLGHVLAEEVISDIDMPPFDKSLVDGFAVRLDDLPQGRGQLSVVDEIVAGSPGWTDDRSLGVGQAVRIMTGAPIPPKSDAVVMVERTASTEGGGVAVEDSQFRAGQNIMRRGMELTNGQTVLHAGSPIRPAEIGVLAAVGRASVSVYPRACVAIVCTGNELVDVDRRPGSGQIRNSNGPVLSALVARTGGTPRYLGVARDTAEEIERYVGEGLQSDIVVLSGGVSAGTLDLVPGVLQKLGVREVFHKVNMKPGKPIWFGVAARYPTAGTSQVGESAPPLLVFGLPGNPVSVMACFELFVAPAIRRMMGFSNPGPYTLCAVLTEDRSSRSDRPTYWPAWVEQSKDGPVVRLVAWKGSPDLRATTEANCFAIFPAGEYQFRRGERIEVLTY